MVTQAQLEKCVTIAKKYGVKKLVLFGSAVDDPVNARDIDFICTGVNGLELLRMVGEMENEISVLVDAVPGDQETPFVKFNLPLGKILYEAA
ncbi:MAG: hypothetical protein JNL74_03370 [Fibrobacteres bacterium]|nr:hypothetical protein [Fibrobacterota bacterium]